MPVDPSPPAPIAVLPPHRRKLAFAVGAIATTIAILAVRALLGHP